ncbi:MAG: A/G-specific adenine glycosylase [Planctomycetes bacterium]|nr:A/G-specific adenine glycosylase [Planctomycetota bacterium]
MSDRLGKDQVAALLGWFAARQRSLPWRMAPAGQRPPYAVWVSEIMLQQTRVEVVVPYFEAWMRSFPTVEALAEASEDEVLRHWAGLGYYRRARFLHRAAQELVAAGARGQGGAAWPQSAAAWAELPGIGEYTAAAVASLSCGEAAPVVDGNVKRVVARCAGLELASDTRALHRESAAWMAAAMELLPKAEGPGAWNEAVMELGATVCTPRSPACAACPVADGCHINDGRGPEDAARLAEAYPLPPKAKNWIELELVYGLAACPQEGGVLLVQRIEGWNPGLWEPPSLVRESSGASPEDLQAAWQGSGAPGQLGEELGVVRHTITRHKIQARVHLLETPADTAYQDPSQVGLTGLARKILRRWV